jgi:RNA polymerase sigma-70 factor (ECF subfamily)
MLHLTPSIEPRLTPRTTRLVNRVEMATRACPFRDRPIVHRRAPHHRAATTKRLTRARRKIAAAHIPYRVPAQDELADRLPAVCGVIHSLYTAGHAPVDGRVAYDVDACAEAVRLAELLHELLPDQPMPASVLALLLLTAARRRGRLDDHGDVVTLDQQDRGRWDAAAIVHGIALLNDSLRRSCGQADAYQLQAAIGAEQPVPPVMTTPTGRRSCGSTTCS